MLKQIVNFDPILVFLAATIFSGVMFLLTRALVHLLYAGVLSRWGFLASKVESISRKGGPLIKKYGILGLMIYVAVPVPGTGIYTAAVLSWLMGLKWQTSLLAILPASAPSNIVVTVGITAMLSHVILVA